HAASCATATAHDNGSVRIRPPSSMRWGTVRTGAQADCAMKRRGDVDDKLTPATARVHQLSPCPRLRRSRRSRSREHRAGVSVLDGEGVAVSAAHLGLPVWWEALLG